MRTILLNGVDPGHTVELRQTPEGCKVYVSYSPGSPILISLDKGEAQRLYEYLDMENVDPYTAWNGHMGLRVVQEADGRTWVRAWHETGAGRLIFLPDAETGRLYDWLGGLLG